MQVVDVGEVQDEELSHQVVLEHAIGLPIGGEGDGETAVAEDPEEAGAGAACTVQYIGHVLLAEQARVKKLRPNAVLVEGLRRSAVGSAVRRPGCTGVE